MTQDFKTTLFSIEENSRSCSEDDSETDGETGASLNQQDQIPTCVCMGCRQVFEIVDTFLTIIICDLRNPKVRCVYCDNLINCFTAKSINYICLNSVPVPVPGAPVPLTPLLQPAEFPIPIKSDFNPPPSPPIRHLIIPPFV